MTDRYKEIHYEALSNNGSAELQNIYSWLNLSAEPSFCEQVVEAGTVDRLREQKDFAPQEFFRKGRASAWKKELTLSEKKSWSTWLATFSRRWDMSSRVVI